MAVKSLKEKTALFVLGIFVLYAITIGCWFLFSKSRVASEKKYSNAVKRYNDQKKVISQRAEWEELHETVASRIPTVDGSVDTSTKWMRLIGEIAEKNNIRISSIKAKNPDNEEDFVIGDMEVLEVDIRWIGAVESLVKFLYALENTDQGMFDVQSLNFSPQSKLKGFMDGNMSIKCIFKR